MAPELMLLVGADVGGTFTDLVLTDTDRNSTLIHKVPSTPDDPSEAVLQGILEICAQAGCEAGEIDHIFHGTTVATNAALQYRGCVAGMITTRGFRDIIHIGRHQRPQHYSIQQEIPWQERPLVRRRHRKVVTERLAPPSGEVIAPLDASEVRQAARELAEDGVERRLRSASCSPTSIRYTSCAHGTSSERNAPRSSCPVRTKSHRSFGSSNVSRLQR